MPRNAVEQFKVHSQFPIRWLPNEMNIVIIVWVQDTASKEYLKQYKILSTPLNFKYKTILHFLLGLFLMISNIIFLGYNILDKV